MEWDTRPDGELLLALLRNVELAVAADHAVAIRFEFAEVEEQASGGMALSSKQFVLAPEAAEHLGKELPSAALLARKAVGVG